jgi:uncharacterized protein YbjQ (UPF0145 family)
MTFPSADTMERARALRSAVVWASNEAVEIIAQALHDAQEEARRETIARLADVAIAVGSQANVGAMELAGQFVSVLSANPEHIERFMAEGTELVIDGTLNAENGCLTYYGADGSMHSPSEIRARKGQQQ